LNSPGAAEPLVIRPPAELDLASAPRLGAEIFDALRRGNLWLVLDFADVRLIDSAGIGVLLSAQRQARVAGGGLVVANASEKVARIFVLTGVERALGVAGSRRAA
jgi:anti-anti-sigma factor